MSNTEKSKFLSFVLRHAPEKIGLSLDEQGWAEVDALLQKLQDAGQLLSRTELLEIVATNDKKRFTLSNDGSRIRAAQGHSVKVDPGLTALTQPGSANATASL